MAAGNRKSSNKRKTQTKKERMAEMEKAQAFRVEVTLWIVVAAALLLFISNLGFGGAVGKTVSGFLFGMFGLMAYVRPVQNGIPGAASSADVWLITCVRHLD